MKQRAMQHIQYGLLDFTLSSEYYKKALKDWKLPEFKRLLVNIMVAFSTGLGVNDEEVLSEHTRK
jgi:hypothetical protein